MQTFTQPAELKSAAQAIRANGGRIALISTMGNLHAGHASLVAAAKAAGETVVLTIIVNQLEFGANEATIQVPRNLSADLAAAEAFGVDIVFAPEFETLHPPGHATFVEETHRSRKLCGISRPTHFRGFLTHYLKLIHCASPHSTYFGHKDLQQAAVIRQAAHDLFIDLDVRLLPTVREADGLAIGWRNRLLTPNQRAEAAIIPEALERSAALTRQGYRSVDRIIAEATHTLTSKRMIRVIYVQCIDPDSSDPVREIIPGHTVLAIAVWVDELRLLDNCIL
jgi:pantoate--beta-alanine ligase